MKKVLVIGLDSMPDKEIFEKNRNELPNLSKMLDHGYYATLESCHPPITVPAWRVMMSSKTPGRLGVYGFRHRKGSLILMDGSQHLKHFMNQWYGIF